MSKPQLDRSRNDVGQITPPYRGAFWTQNGHYFAHDGAYLFSDGAVPEAASDEPDGASAPSEEAHTSTHESADARSASAEGNAPSEAKAPSTGKEIDLAAWARDDIKAPFFSVKKQVREDYPDIDIKSAKTIRAGLVAAGVVSADEVA
ncbi:hypothetical protein [Pseudohoeflea coraliihabitans]|uniref:Uncharacterized protein n=1 Tax=Pseudohoeflea coraliihabitans TaxID=2860393 RepID=A0ABS6WTI7_9HYPH|nr:hypothetical protein [Pseudohoeflea sp. DP4N28-3]MBW3099256.1 hypothetical protein [Pseudohoeflea sp. DP4N28-3]